MALHETVIGDLNHGCWRKHRIWRRETTWNDLRMHWKCWHHQHAPVASAAVVIEIFCLERPVSHTTHRNEARHHIGFFGK